MLQIIFFTVVAVLLLSFFGVSVQSIIQSPSSEQNFGYLGTMVAAGWHFIVNSGADLITWIWHFIPH